MSELIFILLAYVLGSVATFFLCRRHWIQVGSSLTFDLFVKYGYVRYRHNDNGEVELIKLTAKDFED